MAEQGPPRELALMLLARVQRARRQWERGEASDEDVARVSRDVDRILAGSKAMNISVEVPDGGPD